MDENVQKTAQALKERFGLSMADYRDQATFLVPVEKIVDVIRALRDELGFPMFSGVTGVDYWPRLDPRFHAVYILRSLEYRAHIFLRVPIPAQKPVIPSIVEIFPNANWYERELWDMFGIRCEGHPDLRRILMPYDWEGHPLRKDYPLGYEEVRFTFNEEDVDVRKPFARK